MGRFKKLESKYKSIDTSIGTSASTKRIRGGKHTRIRQRILKRDDYMCQYCERVARDSKASNLEIDHIVPLESGGQETDDNRQVLCIVCHRKKTAREWKEGIGTL